MFKLLIRQGDESSNGIKAGGFSPEILNFVFCNVTIGTEGLRQLLRKEILNTKENYNEQRISLPLGSDIQFQVEIRKLVFILTVLEQWQRPWYAISLQRNHLNIDTPILCIGDALVSLILPGESFREWYTSAIRVWNKLYSYHFSLAARAWLKKIDWLQQYPLQYRPETSIIKVLDKIG